MLDKVLSLLGGNLFTGVTDLVKAFKLPPEQQIAFEAKMAEMEANLRVSLAKIDAEDRNSARQREMTVKDRVPAHLAYASVGGFFSVLAIQFYFAYAGIHIPDSMQRTLDITTGVLFAMVLAVKDYYLGSSKGSDDKTKFLMNGGSSAK